MSLKEKFYDAVKSEPTAILATALNDSVTMRTISPVFYCGCILIFTARDSLKYEQLKSNPNCCIYVGDFFVEADVGFMGETMLDTNKDFRCAYSEKFNDAFDESVEFGGINSEFLLLKPTRLRGWTFADGEPSASGVPTVPFEIVL